MIFRTARFVCVLSLEICGNAPTVFGKEVKYKFTLCELTRRIPVIYFLIDIVRLFASFLVSP